MVVHYPRTVWKICYAEHKETGKTYINKNKKNIAKQIIHNLAHLLYSNRNRSCFGHPSWDLSQDRGGGWGVPMSHVDYKKRQCRPVEFKKLPCRPVEFKKQSCHPVEFKKWPCRMSLRPKKGRVALSILGVHTPRIDSSQDYVL